MVVQYATVAYIGGRQASGWFQYPLCLEWSGQTTAPMCERVEPEEIFTLLSPHPYVYGLSFSYLTNVVYERHIKAPSDFAARIFADSEHPLHEELSKARSHTSTRSRFTLLPSKTAAYRNSVLPALSRLLVDRNAELNYYIQELS